MTGSREFTDKLLVVDVLLPYARYYRHEAVVVHGMADRGLDPLANEVAIFLGMRVEPHPADWNSCAADCPPAHRKTRRAFGRTWTYCPTAGHRRNQEMVDAEADVCHAFYREGAGNRGTTDCVRRAETANIPVFAYTQTREAA